MKKSKTILKKGKGKAPVGKLLKKSDKKIEAIAFNEPVLNKETAKSDLTYWTKKLDFYKEKGMLDQVKMCENMIDHYLDKLSTLLRDESKLSQNSAQ